MAVAIQHRSLNHIYRASPEAVPLARSAVADFAVHAGASEVTVGAIRLAVSEAFTNAVVHGYPDEPGEVEVTAAAAGNELRVLIADDGRGHRTPPVAPGLGWGLALIAEASEDFLVVERGNGGTEVRMRFTLRPARWAAGPMKRL